MALWTEFEDVTARWVGDNVPTDEALVGALIEDAEAVILAAYPRIEDRITAETLSQAVVTMVTVRMVTRLLRNPENLTYWQQNVGPFGSGKNYGSGNTDIWLTDDERALLSPQGGRKAFTVNQGTEAVDGRSVITIIEPTTIEPVWMDVE